MITSYKSKISSTASNNNSIIGDRQSASAVNVSKPLKINTLSSVNSMVSASKSPILDSKILSNATKNSPFSKRQPMKIFRNINELINYKPTANRHAVASSSFSSIKKDTKKTPKITHNISSNNVILQPNIKSSLPFKQSNLTDNKYPSYKTTKVSEQYINLSSKVSSNNTVSVKNPSIKKTPNKTSGKNSSLNSQTVNSALKEYSSVIEKSIKQVVICLNKIHDDIQKIYPEKELENYINKNVEKVENTIESLQKDLKEKIEQQVSNTYSLEGSIGSLKDTLNSKVELKPDVIENIISKAVDSITTKIKQIETIHIQAKEYTEKHLSKLMQDLVSQYNSSSNQNNTLLRSAIKDLTQNQSAILQKTDNLKDSVINNKSFKVFVEELKTDNHKLTAKHQDISAQIMQDMRSIKNSITSLVAEYRQKKQNKTLENKEVAQKSVSYDASTKSAYVAKEVTSTQKSKETPSSSTIDFAVTKLREALDLENMETGASKVTVSTEPTTVTSSQPKQNNSHANASYSISKPISTTIEAEVVEKKAQNEKAITTNNSASSNKVTKDTLCKVDVSQFFK